MDVIAIAKKGEDIMVVKVLGTGCKSCKMLEANAIEAVKQLGSDAKVEKVEKVEKIEDIMAYGVMATPALVVDEVVKSMGRILSPEDIKKFLV